MATQEEMLQFFSREMGKHQSKLTELKKDYQDYINLVSHSAIRGKKDKVSIVIKDKAMAVKRKYEKRAEEMAIDMNHYVLHALGEQDE